MPDIIPNKYQIYDLSEVMYHGITPVGTIVAFPKLRRFNFYGSETLKFDFLSVGNTPKKTNFACELRQTVFESSELQAVRFFPHANGNS